MGAGAGVACLQSTACRIAISSQSLAKGSGRDKGNPFEECLAPRFRPEAVEISFLKASDLARVLLTMRELGRDYSGRLAAHLAEGALFYGLPVPRVGAIDRGSARSQRGGGGDGGSIESEGRKI